MANRSPTGAWGSFPHPQLPPGLVVRVHFAGGSRNVITHPVFRNPLVCRLPQRLLQTIQSGHPC